MMLVQIQVDLPPRPRSLRPGITRDLETICLKCLEKLPAHRYDTAQDLAADLRRWLDHKPIAARRAGPVTRSMRWARRNPALAILGTITAILFASVVYPVIRPIVRGLADFHKTVSSTTVPDRSQEVDSRKREVVHDSKANVVGEVISPTGIMFILDCSGSMAQVVPDGSNSVTRLTVARNALYTVLQSLASKKDPCRAGVVVFGHRICYGDGVRYPTEELLTHVPDNLGLVPVKKLNPPIPNLVSLDPDSDVEVVTPMASLTPMRVKEITSRLDKLLPTGQTPLYLAIQSAVDELNHDRTAERKQIIVLTDGVNEQVRSLHQTTARQIRDIFTRDGSRIRLDIVGFQINANDLSMAAKEEYHEMLQLVAGCRGEFFDVCDSASLLAALAKSLALGK